MREYLETTRCRMQFLTDLLDDPARDACGICDNCTGESAAVELPTDLLAAAEDVSAKPAVDHHAEAPGSARSAIASRKGAPSPNGETPDGARSCVREGRTAEAFDDRLVDALAEMIRVWRPEPAPEWITAVPSLRRPTNSSTDSRVRSRPGWSCRTSPASSRSTSGPSSGTNRIGPPGSATSQARSRSTARSRPARACSSTISSTRLDDDGGRSVLRRAGCRTGLPCGIGFDSRTRHMNPSPDTSRAALLLTNRLVKIDAKPMTAREFWHVVEQGRGPVRS